MGSAAEDFLDERIRAQDILLGALGYGEDATILTVKQTETGYSGTARWSDGEEFEFESQDPPTEIEVWALGILV